MDNVLNNIGDDYGHDAIHDLSDAEEDEEDKLAAAGCDSEGETAVAADNEDDGDDATASSDGDDATAVAAVSATDAADDKTCVEFVALSKQQADAVHQNKVQIATLQEAIEAIKLTGQLRVALQVEQHIVKLKRRQRLICSETPVVAEAFKRQRLIEDADHRERTFMVKQTKELRKTAQTAVAEKKEALAALAKIKRAQQDIESKHACSAAMKMFSVEMLGANDSKAGGAASRKNRVEVLDRVARHGAGLSAAQQNDFEWWKRAWDDAMVEQHKGQWAETFATWMQDVISSSETNAFSQFMHTETNRVLRHLFPKVLAVPGLK